MTMKNYGELKTEVASWLNRTDTETVSRIPDFLRNMESELYRGLEVRDNEFIAAYTQDDNPKNPIVLPDNFQSFKVVTFNDKPLDRVSDLQFAAIQYSGDSSPPHSFTTEEREMVLAPWVDDDIDPAGGDFTIEVHYYGTESLGEMAFWNTATNPNFLPESDGTPAEFTQRTDAATTRLFLRNPDLYLAGCLYWGFLFLQDDKNAMKWKAIFDNGNANLKKAAKRARRSGSTPKVAGAYEAPDSRTYRDNGTGASRYW